MMNNKTSIPNIVPNRQQCKNCIHKHMRYDESFIVNGEHYYCDATALVVYEYDNYEYLDWVESNIDGYWWESGDCPYYKAEEASAEWEWKDDEPLSWDD